ncbi:MAG: hypothetical protein IJK51_08435 [Bacteroidaceae bacterium]|nr:hypothetical protein [Bacteroidaceae bacterium]
MYNVGEKGLLEWFASFWPTFFKKNEKKNEKSFGGYEKSTKFAAEKV